MAGTITLTRGGTSITIAAPAYPTREPEQYPQLVARMWGGAIKVCDLGDGTTAWDDPELYWDLLSDSDYTALKGFVETTLVWGANSCTYTDEAGDSHTNLHYVGGLPFTAAAYDYWSGTLQLQKDMGA